MTFRLYNTLVGFSFLAEHPSIMKKVLISLFELWESSPLKPLYPEIPGWYLSGDRYFHKIRPALIRNLNESEISSIERVTPLVEDSILQKMKQEGRQ